MGSSRFNPWKFPGPGNFHGVGHGNFHGLPNAKKLHYCTLVGFFVTNAKLQTEWAMDFPCPTNHGIIWTGVNRKIEVGQK